jgi:hypothetical protein
VERRGIVCVTAFLGCTIFFSAGFSQKEAVSKASPPLRLIQEIPLPGVQGRIDHFAVDPERERLILSALGNNTVEIVSLIAGKVLHSIAGLHGPQGVLYVPENDRICRDELRGRQSQCVRWDFLRVSKNSGFWQGPR